LTQQAWSIVDSFLMQTAILFLLAAGFFLIHRTANFLNIAHPDYATVGAYSIWSVASLLGWNVWIATVISMVAIGIIANLIDRGSYRYLRGAPLPLLLCSMGVGLVVRYAAFMIWGGRFKKLTVILPNLEIGGIVVSGSLLLALVFVGLVILLFYFILNYTRLGISIRAVADSPSLAENFGIDTERTMKFVWFLTGCSASLGGLVLAFYQPLTYDVGFHWILLIVAVSILAGERIKFHNLLGACVVITAGMEIGLFFIPEYYRMGIGFAMLIIAILVRRVLQK